jgi:TetR/AcrR family transcriptional regulator, transcriptional repressor for nem operon
MKCFAEEWVCGHPFWGTHKKMTRAYIRQVVRRSRRKEKILHPQDYRCNLIDCMRYEPDHKSRTHRRIVKNAARRLRVDGLQGPGVATLMKASGLTVGGFYKHFRRKDDLLAEAIEEGFTEHGEKFLATLQNVPPAERWKAIVRHYLSAEHCEHPEAGCPIATLAPEIARAAPAVRKRVANLMEARRERVLQFMPGETPAERERSFNIIFPAMAGAISVARILPFPQEREKILNALRDHLLKSF